MEVLDANIFVDINSYSKKLTISKVIKYFEIKNVFFTKTMIQNYSKIGLLPEVVDKRYYNINHLVILYLTYILKNTYSLTYIITVIKPLHNIDDLTNTYNLIASNNTLISPIVDKFIVSVDSVLNNEVNTVTSINKMLSVNNIKNNSVT